MMGIYKTGVEKDEIFPVQTRTGYGRNHIVSNENGSKSAVLQGNTKYYHVHVEHADKI